MARVLVTRPEPGASATARRLVALGHQPVVLPLSEIRPLPAASPAPGTWDVIAATSANAFRNLPAGVSHSRRCHVVGEKTAKAARQAGFVDVLAAGADGAALAAAIAAREPAGTRVLYPCGRVRRPEFERRLAEAGMPCLPLEVYDTVFTEPGEARLAEVGTGGDLDAVLVYSPQAARALSRLLDTGDGRAALLNAVFLCLSDQVASALGTAGADRTYVSREPSEDALLALLAAH